MQLNNDLNISEVCQQTGVAAVTLRAWERRYGLIKPKRTPKGHRLYSQEDIVLIKQIVSWLERGVAIRKVADLLTTPEASVQIDENEASWQQTQHDIFNTLIGLKQKNLNPLLDNLNKSMPFLTLCEKVYQPLTRQLIARWQNKPLGYQLESQLWQQCWERQITLMTLRAEKQKPKASCWFINLDNQGIALDYWLFYGLLLQSGIQVHAINQSDDLSALPRLKKSLDQPLILFGNHKISPRRMDQLIKVIALCHDNVFAIGPIADIHRDIFTNITIEHTGGDANSCWQSSQYQDWIQRMIEKQDNQ